MNRFPWHGNIIIIIIKCKYYPSMNSLVYLFCYDLILFQAKKNGADGVEIDLSFTKDNIAVLFHDDTLERTTNGFGNLAAKTFTEVRELDAAANHIYRYV